MSNLLLWGVGILCFAVGAVGDDHCGHWQSSYKRFHQQTLNSPTTNADGVRSRYLLHYPNYGFGNRLYGVSSALLFAVLTNRALLIKDDFLSTFFAPAGINWTLSDAHRQAFIEAENNPNRTEEWATSEWRLLHLEHCAPKARATMEKLATIVDVNTLWNESLVVLRTNMLWQGYLFQNPNYRRILQDEWAINSVDSWFPCAMKFLFENKPFVQHKLDELVTEIYQGSSFNIGLQIRAHPWSGYVRVEDVQYFARCAKHIEREHGVDPKHSQWIVVTDMPELVMPALKLTSEGSDRKIWIWHDAAHVQVEEELSLKTVIDHQLMSFCNDSVLTFLSTFGLTGVYWNPAMQHAHHLFGSHYSRPENGLTCERRLCNGRDHHACWIHEFGYWDYCEVDPPLKGTYLPQGYSDDFPTMLYPNSPVQDWEEEEYEE